MTINQAIARADALRDNSMPTDMKISWLSAVDQQIYEEIIKGRAGEELVTFPVYNVNDGERVLLVPPPYDMLYVYRLESEICYELKEIAHQANALTRYNEFMSGFAKMYIREHSANSHTPVIYY